MGAKLSTIFASHIIEFNTKHYEALILWMTDNYSSIRIYEGLNEILNKEVDISLCSEYEFDDWEYGFRLDKIVLNLALTCKDFNYLYNRYKCALFLNVGRIMIWSENNIIYRQTFNFGYYRIVRQCRKLDGCWCVIIDKPKGRYIKVIEVKTPDQLDMKRLYYENAFVGESVCGDCRYKVGSDIYQNEAHRLSMINLY